MSQFRSEDMTLLQVMLPHDTGYEITSKLLELDMVHYVDLNKNRMANELRFTELLKRAEETSRKINNIEQIYSDYSVDLRAPTEIEKLNEKIEVILASSNVAASKLLQQIDQDIDQQDEFLKT